MILHLQIFILKLIIKIYIVEIFVCYWIKKSYSNKINIKQNKKKKKRYYS